MTVRVINTKTIFTKKYHIIDARTPAEFEQGHIPNAINIPLFTNEQRVEVGTLYKQESPVRAFDRGIEIVGPEMVNFVKQVRSLSNLPLAIYCWRGGMRSESMGWLFSMAGLDVVKIEGGYKGYRGFIRGEFGTPAKITILSGRTGSGKTHYLQALAKEGEQVLDLEGLANHMGSSFGYKGHNLQPTNEQFENNCYEVWFGFDLNRNIWIEDESAAIGKVRICDPLYDQMLSAKVIELQIDLDKRIENIVYDYKDVETEVLIRACDHIKKRLGAQRYEASTELIKQKNYAKAVPILLEYYDALYDRYADKHPRETISIKNPLVSQLQDLLLDQN